MMPFPQMVKPFVLSALIKAAKYLQVSPSMRVSIKGKSSIRSEPFSLPPFSTIRCVPEWKNRLPERKVPLGITTTPPPSEAHLSILETRNTLNDIGNFWDDLFPAERDRLLHLLVENVTVLETGITIKIKTAGMRGLIKEVQSAKD